MTPVPLDLPLRPPDAAELASLIFDLAEGKPLTDDTRNRIAARAVPLKLQSIEPCFGSLERDPVHHSTYYLVVDVAQGPPQLLHMAPALAPTSSLFHRALLIGRMRRAKGPEILINAVPFGLEDTENIDKLAALDPSFAPRPQGPRPALVAEATPQAFEAFRAVYRRSRKNVASVSGRYHAAVWSAVRAGWREGYGASIDLPVTDEASFGAAREAIRQAPRYSRFVIAGSVTEVERLSIWIRQARSAAKVAGNFELGISLEDREVPTTPEELALCLGALKDAGHPAHVAAPRLAVENISGLAAVAKQFNCVLRISAASHPFEVLKAVARESAGRFSCVLDAGYTGNIEDLAESLLG